MQYYKLPQPRWAAGKGPTIAVTEVNGNILVTHATDLQRTPPSIDLNNPEADDSVEDKDPDIEVVVSIFDAATGRMENRPALVCKDGAEAGQCFVIDGTLYVNCGDRLVAWQSEQSSWTTVVEKVEHRLQSPVVAMDGCIYVLWCGPSNTENQEYQFSKTAQGRTVWGPRFGPTNGHRAEWQVFMGDLYVRCQIGGVSPDVPVPTMFRVNADSLAVEAEAAPGIRGKMLIADRQLFCDGEIDFGEVASPKQLIFKRDAAEQEPSGRSSQDVMVIEATHFMPTASTFLSCYDLPALTLRKRWRIWRSAQSLTVAPKRRAILITHEDTDELRLLSSRTAEPMLVGSIQGKAICDPVNIGRHVLWLSHVDDGDYSLHDYWSQERTLPNALPRYVLAVLDTDTGVLALRDLQLDEPLYAILGYEGDLFFVGWSTIQSIPLASFLERFECPTNIPDLLGEPAETDSPIVRGLPFTGPVADSWGFRSASPVGLQILKATCAPADRERIEADSDFRARALDTRLQETMERVIGSWPDLALLARRKWQPTLGGRYARSFDAVQHTPFGRLGADRDFVAGVMDWYRALNDDTKRHLPSEEEARLTARFLLHEYIRRIKNGVWREYEEPLVDVPKDGWRQELLGWYNLGSAGPGHRGSWVMPSSATTTSGSFFQRVYERRPKVQNGPSADGMYELFERWPRGCPPLIQDVEGRLAYLRQCLEVALLISPDHRSRLQASVARSWDNSIVRRNRQVFISYSHSTSDPARRIAEGLQRRGIGVALDVHELASDAEDWDVETWIAENIMACDLVIYVMSPNFIASGWINRETEWEHRLSGVKRAMTLPYLILTDGSLKLPAYPVGRSCNIAAHESPERFEPILEELAVRITYDLMHSLFSDQTPVAHSLV